MQHVVKNERDVQKKPLLPAKRGRGHPPDAKRIKWKNKIKSDYFELVSLFFKQLSVGYELINKKAKIYSNLFS